ncbi:MAG: sialate O-acetylesterase [Prevotella sp.]|nr:sialate O-acetylesterase [Prevotella sp.]
MKRIALSLIICHLTLVASAEVKLPSFFCDNMVLQQQTECNLWGTADADKQVTIKTSWDNKTYRVKADGTGRFEVKVQTPEAGGPYDITLSDGKPVVLHNILIGEVWLCSGQSNMEMTMKGFKAQPVEGANEELLSCKDDQLRLLYVKRTAQLTPQYDIKGGTWRVADADAVRNFSACAYYFGKVLRKNLGVPVGLICTSFGGSACEAWMKAEWLRAYPQVQQTITEADVKKLNQRCPTALYNGQLYPLIGYNMRGVIWYQGEDNVPRYTYYADLLKTMVEGWRSEWKQGDFPFYFCQIAPYEYSLSGMRDSQYLREQQQKAENIIPNSRMAVLMDAGLDYGIHPRKKREAGERLAILALANTYGMKGLPDYAKYGGVEFQGDTAVVSFENSKEWVYFEHGTTSKNFEVAGADRVFHPATKVWISRNRLYVQCDKVKEPVAVRYAFKDYADGDLMHDGLPVSSFRTDDWEYNPTPVTSDKDYNE